MIRATFVTAAAALTCISVPLASQEVVCALGYASAISNLGVAVAPEEDEEEAHRSSTGTDLLRAQAACGRWSFLSANPSLLANDGGLGENPWGLEFQPGKRGVSAALQSLGAFRAAPAGRGGSVRPGWGGLSMDGEGDLDPLGAKGGADGGQWAASQGGSSQVPEVICTFFGGGSCDGSGGLGNGSTHPSDYLKGNTGTFVDLIHDANGGGGNGVNGGNGNGANPGVAGPTVLDLGDGSADAADIAPEPATMILVASGLLGMAAAKRKRG